LSEQTTAKGPAVRFPPPLVPLLALGAGMLVHWLLPLSTTIIAGGGARYAIGGALVVGGLISMALAIGWFRKTGQDPAPWTESPELILEGVYKWTRNPMYLGMGLLQAGLGLLLGTLWPLLLVPVSWWAIYLIAIRHEETYLSEKFGEGYERYRASVRRWL
jgi:protein-S-isoprenylcysteine O-methyltransferase Ste14